MRVLAIGAHPDDIEFQCAGTLALLRQRGHTITLAAVNTGSGGSARVGPEEIARIRGEEARRSAALLDAEFLCAGIPDVETVFDNPTRRRVAEIVRRAQPDLLFTHYPTDYMPDHDLASLLARDAALNATLRNYATGAPDPAPKTNRIPTVYYFSPVEGRDILGADVRFDLIVDVSSVLDLKTRMLCCHASQREWLQITNGIDEYVGFMQRESARLGALRGCAYGEAFRQHRGHAYPRDDLLSRLLGQPTAAPAPA